MTLASLFGALALLAPAPAPKPATLVAFGDAAACNVQTDSSVARVVTKIHGTVALLGDSTYERGSADEFRRCYLPVFGRFLGRTRAARGNHEYGTGDARAAISTFRRLARRRPQLELLVRRRLRPRLAAGALAPP